MCFGELGRGISYLVIPNTERFNQGIDCPEAKFQLFFKYRFKFISTYLKN
jgi:hypothetical protein